MGDSNVSPVCHRLFRRPDGGWFPGDRLFTLTGSRGSGHRRRDAPYVRFGSPTGPPPLFRSARKAIRPDPAVTTNGCRGRRSGCWTRTPPRRFAGSSRKTGRDEMGEMVEGVAAGVPFVAGPPGDPGPPPGPGGGWRPLGLAAAPTAHADGAARGG